MRIKSSPAAAPALLSATTFWKALLSRPITYRRGAAQDLRAARRSRDEPHDSALGMRRAKGQAAAVISRLCARVLLRSQRPWPRSW